MIHNLVSVPDWFMKGHKCFLPTKALISWRFFQKCFLKSTWILVKIWTCILRTAQKLKRLFFLEYRKWSRHRKHAELGKGKQDIKRHHAYDMIKYSSHIHTGVMKKKQRGQTHDAFPQKPYQNILSSNSTLPFDSLNSLAKSLMTKTHVTFGIVCILGESNWKQKKSAFACIVLLICCCIICMSTLSKKFRDLWKF